MKEDIFPKPSSSIASTDIGWKVEVRVAEYRDPITLPCGQMISHKWRTLETFPVESGTGVVVKKSYMGLSEHYGLLNYAAAQSLRWGIHSWYEATDISGLALETRLVKYDVKYEISCTALSAHLHIHGEDRSCLFPEWNKESLAKKAKADEKQARIDVLEGIIKRRTAELDVENTSKTQLDKHKLILSALEYELEELKNSS